MLSSRRCATLHKLSTGRIQRGSAVRVLGARGASLCSRRGGGILTRRSGCRGLRALCISPPEALGWAATRARPYMCGWLVMRPAGAGTPRWPAEGWLRARLWVSEHHLYGRATSRILHYYLLSSLPPRVMMACTCADGVALRIFQNIPNSNKSNRHSFVCFSGFTERMVEARANQSIESTARRQPAGDIE